MNKQKPKSFCFCYNEQKDDLKKQVASRKLCSEINFHQNTLETEAKVISSKSQKEEKTNELINRGDSQGQLELGSQSLSNQWSIDQQQININLESKPSALFQLKQDLKETARPQQPTSVASPNQGQKFISSCSLDANHIEQFQKIIESKHKRELNTVCSEVNLFFKFQRIFILRDNMNKYNTLAYCTQHQFFAAPSTNNQKQNGIKEKKDNTNLDFIYNPSLYSKPLYINPGKIDFTPEKIAIHIAQTLKECNTIIDACAGVGGMTIQFQNMKQCVFSVDNNLKTLQKCLENVRLFDDKRWNSKVEYICDDFLNLTQNKFGMHRADAVFINPDIEKPLSETLRSDIFTSCKPNLFLALKHGYSLSKNIAILLPSHINLSQIPILLDKFYREFPFAEFQCPHIQVIYLNGSVKYFLILIGEISKVAEEEQIDFFLETIREKSLFPRGSYEVRVKDLLKQIQMKVGIKKLLSTLIKSIDRNDLERQGNLLSYFIEEELKEKNVNEMDIKALLNLSGNPSSDSVCENASLGQFAFSAASQQSFEMEMQYGSNQSLKYKQSPVYSSSPFQLPQQTLSYENASSGGYEYVESTLGDQQLNSFEEELSHKNNDEFYFNEQTREQLRMQDNGLNIQTL